MRSRTPLPCLLLLGLSSLLIAQIASADSATWNLNPTSGDWNTAANWTPAIVPSETATFDASNVTAITVSSSTSLSDIVFDGGASPFSFTLSPATSLMLTGGGITNNSGVMQSFLLQIDADGVQSWIGLDGHATVGDMISFHLQGNPIFAVYPTYVTFLGHSNAGNGSFTCDGGVSRGAYGGNVSFAEHTRAGNAMIANNGGVDGGAGGTTFFSGYANAGNATIICQGGTNGGEGGIIIFGQFANPGNATFIINGGAGSGSAGKISFSSLREPSPNNSRVELNGNGLLSLLGAYHDGAEVGSIEGDGLVDLAHRPLTVGRNNQSTTFSGVISGDATGRAIVKVGTGVFNLTGANTYTGVTVVLEGELAVNNTSGSATGTSTVGLANGTTLSGAGIIAGAVTIGQNALTAPAASLSPGNGAQEAVMLTIQNTLTLRRRAAYNCQLHSHQPATDQVMAQGIAIQNGARFFLLDQDGQSVPPGTTFVVINNTASTPITGTFANLPNGGIITAGPNTLQASYEGGDGNDLTLTVVP